MHVYDTTNCSQGDVDTMAHFHTLILGGLIHMSMCFGDFMSPSQFNNFVQYLIFSIQKIFPQYHIINTKLRLHFFFMGDPLAQRNNTAGCDTLCYNIIVNCVLISSNTVIILIHILILVSSRSTVRWSGGGRFSIKNWKLLLFQKFAHSFYFKEQLPVRKFKIN